MKRRAGRPLRMALERGGDQLRLHRLLQPRVARQAEHVVHAIGLAPGHQGLAGEAGIAAQQDARPRPAAADAADDPRDLLHRAGRAVDVRAPQLRRQQVTAAEDVERQVAVAVVIAVEEPAFLLAVQRIVRGIQVEDDLPRRLGVRLQEQIDEQRLDRRRVMADLVVARRLRPAQLQPVQRDLAGHRRAVGTRGASSLPASTAITGSWRSSSWSFRSS